MIITYNVDIEIIYGVKNKIIECQNSLLRN